MSGIPAEIIDYLLSGGEFTMGVVTLYWLHGQMLKLADIERRLIRIEGRPLHLARDDSKQTSLRESEGTA